MTGVAIRTDKLVKRYGTVTAVDRLDLEVNRGEVFGLLGPNGAGKTTTILMLLGLTEPTSGRAEVAGLDPLRQPLAVKRRVGYVPDSVGFYEGLTGLENLRYTMRLNGLGDNGRRADRDAPLRALLDRVGLGSAADAAVGTYSRGMRQRLGIADALVKEPEVLILDEPTIAIDPEGVTEVLRLIRALADESGVALLLSSHLLHQVQSVCDRVAIFVAGRIVAQGRMTELADQLTQGPTTIEVGVQADPDAAERVLRALPGVRRVETDRRAADRWLLTADRDRRAEVSRALAGDGLTVTHLQRRHEQLDELYHRYFEREAAP